MTERSRAQLTPGATKGGPRLPIRSEELRAQLVELHSALGSHCVSFDDVARCRFLLRRSELPIEEILELQDLFPALLRDFSTRHRIESIYFCERLDLALAVTEPPRDRGPYPRRSYWVFPRGFRERRDVPRLHLARVGTDPDSAVARELLFRGLDLHQRAIEFLPPRTGRVVVERVASTLTSLLGILDAEQARHGELSQFSSRASEIEMLGSQLDEADSYYSERVNVARQAEYVAGMAVGMLGVAVVATIIGFAADVHILKNRAWVAALGGALGAVVSVLQRVTAGRLSLTDEAPRAVVGPLGALRPLIGAVFGLVIYVMLSGGLLGIQLSGDNVVASYAVIGFLAGFAERFAQDVMTAKSPVRRSSQVVSGVGVSADLTYRLPATVEQTITSALRGPELIRWHGIIRWSVAGDTGEHVGRDEDGRFVVASGQHHRMVVQLLQESTGDDLERVVDITTGAFADQAPFTVTIVSDTVSFEPTEYPMPAPPGGASGKLAVPFAAPTTEGPYRAWIQLRQQGRIIRMTPVELLVSHQART
jgi:hypothetical protein